MNILYISKDLGHVSYAASSGGVLHVQLCSWLMQLCVSSQPAVMVCMGAPFCGARSFTAVLGC